MTDALPPLHLVVRDGVAASPEAIARDAVGARSLADLYAYGPGTTVRAMMNTTIDGAIAGSDGTSGTLHNADDSFVFGVLRALADVVLVGSQTVRVEDYRRPRGRKDLLSPSLRLSGTDAPALAIMTASGDIPGSIDAAWPTYLLAPKHAVEKVRARSGFPAEHVITAATPAEIIAALGMLGHRAIQIEGGPSALGRFAAAGVLDELCVSTTHRTVGGESPRMIDGDLHDASWGLRSLLVGPEASCARYSRSPVESA